LHQLEKKKKEKRSIRFSIELQSGRQSGEEECFESRQWARIFRHVSGSFPLGCDEKRSGYQELAEPGKKRVKMLLEERARRADDKVSSR